MENSITELMFEKRLLKNEENDRQARDKIENDLDKTFMVEAGAGAGKTTSLVKRIINEVLEGKFTIDKIAAITFTNKAADELRIRFRMELENYHKNISRDSYKKKRVEAALRDLPLCYIGTIHSFCSKLLRQRPIEAHVMLDFKEIDDNDEEKLKLKYWYEFLDYMYLNHIDEINTLKSYNVNIEDLQSTFMHLSDFTDIEKVNDQQSISFNDEIDKIYEDIINDLQIIKNFIRNEANPDYKYQEKLLNKLNELQNITKTEEKINFITSVKEIFKGKISTSKCTDSEIAAIHVKEIKNKLKKIEIKNSNTDINIEEQYNLSMDFIEKCISYYSRKKESLGILGFQDLLLKTRDMLRDNKEVRQYFSHKYQYILVDEFQDTDPLQVEIVLFLTGINTEEKNFRNIKIRPGSLFIVGDPKQSIYRFRGADISLYNEVKTIVKSSGGEILQLSTNFRSTNVMCNYFNDIFKNLFHIELNNYQAKFCFMHHKRECTQNTTSGVYKLIVKEQENRGNKRKKINTETVAEYVAQYIYNCINDNFYIEDKNSENCILRKVTPKDFMILTYRRNEVGDYRRALEKRDIPCKTTGDLRIGEYESINGLLNTLKTINDSEDQIALITSLKTCFGISDQMLYDFKSLNLPLSINNNFDKIDIPNLKMLINALKKLKSYMVIKNTLPPLSLLQKIIMELKIIPWSLSIGDMEVPNNLYNIIEIIRNSDDDCKYNFSSMVSKFEEICENSVDEILEIKTDKEDCVRIMNVHKSKGLEAPIVILSSVMIKKDKKILQHIKRSNKKNNGYFTIFKKDKYGKITPLFYPNGWKNIEQEERNFIRSEEVRLQYVASTRAENILVIVSDNENECNLPWNYLFNENMRPIEINFSNDEIKSNEYIEDLHIEKIDDLFTENQKNSSYKSTYPTENETLIDDVKTESGGGTEWGLIIHKVLEEIARKKNNIDSLIKILISNSINHKNDLQKLQDTVKKFKNSKLYTMINNAQEVYPEVRFSVSIDKNDKLYKVYSQDGCEEYIYITGVIDLIIKYKDEYYLIDYKTDQVKTVEDANLRAHNYLNQLMTYKNSWERLSGVNISKVWLYFTYIDKIIEIK